MKQLRDIPYIENGMPAQRLDLYLPDAKTFPVFVFFHGGGLTAGDKADEPFCAELAEAGIAVVSANYRMYPEAAFPDYLEDAAAAVAWVQTHIRAYGTPTGLFVGGSSAGGYITQMLCFDAHYLGKHGIDVQQISGFVMDAGQPTTHFNVLRERGLDSRRVLIDDAAPLYFIDREQSYPPMLILVADHDMTNRYEQTMLLIRTLEHFKCTAGGVELKCITGSKHCEYHNWQEPDGTNTFGSLVKAFISRVDANRSGTI